MYAELNQINIENWQSDPNVSINIGKVIELASWKKSPFEPFVGSGTDRGIRTYKVDVKAPYRPRLQAPLTGSGVRGNADFDTNLDTMEILSQTVEPDNVGNSMKSEIKQYSDIKNIDFVKQAVPSLTDWIVRKRDKYFVTALSNDVTNCVVADAGATGFKDGSNAKSVNELSRQIQKGDVLTVKALSKAIFMAKNGVKYNGKEAFPIKPMRSTRHTVGGVNIENYSYVILLDSYQCNQLRNDPLWREMQKIGVRGNENNIFTGLVGIIENCPVIDMGVWTKLNVGLLNSEVSDAEYKENIIAANFSNKITPPSYYTDTQPLSMGFLIGASALLMVGSEQTKFYIDDMQDVGRKTICGVDKLFAISKARFQSPAGQRTIFDNQDFATIAIFSSKE